MTVTDKTKRIFEVWKSGQFKSMSSLARKYHLTKQRVWFIIKTEQAKESPNESK